MDSHSCCAGREARTRDAMTADGPGDDGPQPPGLEPACSAGQAALLSAMACSSFFHSSPFSVPSPDLSGFSPPVSFKLSTATQTPFGRLRVGPLSTHWSLHLQCPRVHVRQRKAAAPLPRPRPVPGQALNSTVTTGPLLFLQFHFLSSRYFRQPRCTCF